jgi:hypothetical protein
MFRLVLLNRLLPLRNSAGSTGNCTGSRLSHARRLLYHVASCRNVACWLAVCSATALSGLESLSRLKWLCIEGLESHMSTSSVPALGQLTKLTRLQLLNCKGFQPILLSGMMNLQVGLVAQWGGGRGGRVGS